MAILNQVAAIPVFYDSTHFLLLAVEFVTIPGPGKLNLRPGTGWRHCFQFSGPPPGPYDFLKKSIMIRTGDSFPIKGFRGEDGTGTRTSLQ